MNSVPKKAYLLTAVIALLVIAIWVNSAIPRSPWAEYIERNRLRLVVLNAFAVTSFDYHVNFSAMQTANMLNREADMSDKTIMPIIIGPRRPVGLERGDWLRTEIRLNASGKISMPSVDEHRLSSLLAAADGMGTQTTEAAHALINALSKSAPSVNVDVLVKFRSPITDRGLAGVAPEEFPPQTILIAPANMGDQPIVWDRQSCVQRGMGKECMNPHATVSQFSEWVAMLEPEDDALLEQYDLSLAKLRSVAAGGKIYGAIVTAPANLLPPLFANTDVAWAKFLDIVPR
ncbi:MULTISPECIES: hypothetical protein [unclassified Nonomuraea]|uniref:hypothetical protein n=1 Tax=unclassified Nonomuraea TaxID=2593643 RepID=UPI0033EDCE74